MPESGFRFATLQPEAPFRFKEIAMAVAGPRAHHQVTFAVLALGVAAFALLQSLVIPVLTTVQHELHTSQGTATWVLTAYLLSASIMTPILGRIGDMTGKKRVFVATLIALAAGSLLAAVASSIGVLIVARVIQGIGGGMVPVAFGIIRDEFPARKVTGAVGILASLTAVGAGLGIVLAGPIVNLLGYHWLFWLPMVLHVVPPGAAGPVRAELEPSRLPLAVLAADDPHRRRRGVRGAFRARVAGAYPRPDQLAAGPAAVRVAGRAADRAEPGPGVGLGLRPGDRTADRGGGAGRGLGDLRAARGHPADRHEDDAADGRVDPQPGRAADRGRYVRDVRLPARVRPEPRRGRLRLRRQHHPLRADAAALGDHHVRRGHVRRPAGRPARRQGPGGCRVPDRVRGHGDPRLRPSAAVGDLPVQRHHGRRVRAGLRGDVRAGRRRGTALANRRRERHEREHPHDRRQHRRGRDGQHRHLPARPVRAAEGGRLHHRVRGHGRQPGAGRARWPIPPACCTTWALWASCPPIPTSTPACSRYRTILASTSSRPSAISSKSTTAQPAPTSPCTWISPPSSPPPSLPTTTNPWPTSAASTTSSR